MLLSWTHLIKNTIPTPPTHTHTSPHGILEPAVLTGAELAAPPSLSETSVTRKHSYGHPHLPHPTQYSCSNFKDKFMSLSSWTEFSNKRNLESLMQNICKLLQDQNDGFGTRKMIQSEGRCSTGGNLHGAVGREINFRWENLERLILKDVRVEVRMTFRLLQGDSQGNMQIKEHLKIQQHQPSKRCHLELLAKAEFLRPQNLTFTVNIWEAKSVKEEDIGFLSCSHLITHTVKMGSFLCHLCLSTPPPPHLRPCAQICTNLSLTVVTFLQRQSWPDTSDV